MTLPSGRTTGPSGKRKPIGNKFEFRHSLSSLSALQGVFQTAAIVFADDVGAFTGLALFGAELSPSPSAICIYTVSSQRPNFRPTLRMRPACSKPILPCNATEAGSPPPITAIIWRNPNAVASAINAASNCDTDPLPHLIGADVDRILARKSIGGTVAKLRCIGISHDLGSAQSDQKWPPFFRDVAYLLFGFSHGAGHRIKAGAAAFDVRSINRGNGRRVRDLGRTKHATARTRFPRFHAEGLT